MEKRYGVLRVIATVYKILGGIVGILTILAVIGILAAFFVRGVSFENLPRMGGRFMPAPLFGSVFGGLVAAGLTLLYGGVLAFMLYGFGEAIYLLIALEENTRLTAQILKNQLERE